MIQANELRIGNYVFNSNGKTCTIDGFKRGDAGHDYEHIAMFKELGIPYCYVNNCDPVPLTPEILEKCWFYLSAKVLYTISIGKEELDIDLLTGEIRIADRYIGLKIKHLHQLQNLYFALTGEELNPQL